MCRCAEQYRERIFYAPLRRPGAGQGPRRKRQRPRAEEPQDTRLDGHRLLEGVGTGQQRHLPVLVRAHRAARGHRSGPAQLVRDRRLDREAACTNVGIIVLRCYWLQGKIFFVSHPRPPWHPFFFVIFRPAAHHHQPCIRREGRRRPGHAASKYQHRLRGTGDRQDD